MRNIRLLSFAAAVLCAFALALHPASAAAGPVELTYSIFFPATHGQCQAAMDWAREIEKRTDGQVKITVFPGGTLTSPPQAYDGVVKGISDIAMSCFAYTRGRFPAMEAVDLPMGYASGLQATRVANDFYQKLKPAELGDVQVMYLHAHGPGLLHTRKPVRTLEDLKGMKIRSTGLSAKIVEALGAVPVAKPQNETYENLQKGVVEGTFGPIEVLKGWRQAEVIKSTTECEVVGYTTTMFVVMNRSKWESLTAAQKAVFEAVNAEFVDVHGRKWDEVDEAGRQYTLSLGNTIVSLSKDEQARWKAAVRPIIDAYIQEADAKGLDGKQLVETLKAAIAANPQ
ncbi:MAG TPA: TRAP transporter substrate-binding protein [Desulfobacteraceae bacterium]|nr:TRAP transporter substrate-binding protein [Deltaproteobacteria bacterium]MBW2356329.1 TRAP transporter substrate-binding protein [Deltaproteobacteria bacterium]RLB95437.1 MAG: C4-dicarboxylate ABC transporter substrate-binding protein [Deltaproteobacteria bacterium]HDI59551.1 TRAP transporter substrate-binding protein [Desulfobacteraceae bacterium]